MITLSQSYPVCFIRTGERAYWLFAGRWFWDNEGLAADQVHALLLTRDQRRQGTIRRAQSTVAMASAPYLFSASRVALTAPDREHPPPGRGAAVGM